MNYPNSIKKTYKRNITYANRGMDLENLLNITNEYYLKNNIGVIYKKPTPIGVVKVKYENNKQIINKGYFKTQSTLDYNGLYKGKYIDFDAKSTLNKTSFPLSNIHEHQIKHIRNVISHGGITFLIIGMNSEIYLLLGQDLISFIDSNNRKSIPYSYLKQYGFNINYKINKPIDYLEVIDSLLLKEVI